MQRQMPQILKLKILHKESVAEYQKQKNESELEDKRVEITSEEQSKKRKRIKRRELRIVSETSGIKCTNIWIIGDPEEEKKKNFEESINENFCYMEKEIVNQVQEAQEFHTG